MKILLAITGSISAYKAYDIARKLINDGHSVRVVLTQGALQFIKPDTFHYLGVENTYLPTDDFNIKQKTKNVLHIELVDWLDTLVVAPISANSIAKFAQGLATDLLSSVFLALDEKPCVLFPAMNSKMLNSPATQRNISFLKSYPNIWIHPSAQGELACGDIGEGKLPEVELISDVVPVWQPRISGKTVLITTGATISRLDSVRYLTNPSSGVTGYLLAKEYLAEGHKVILIAGKESVKAIQHLSSHPHCELTIIESSSEMYEAVHSLIDKADIYISAAAINDIEFETQSGKLKKSQLGESLTIKKATDILASVLASKKEHLKVIGFAAETGNDVQHFIEKWNSKKVDMLVGNFVDAKTEKGFRAMDNEYYFIRNGKVMEQSQLTKQQLANKIAHTQL